MAMSAEHRSKFAALHRQLWRLHVSEKFSSGSIHSKQTNKKLKLNIKKPSIICRNYLLSSQKHL